MDYLVIPAYEPNYNLIRLIKKFVKRVTLSDRNQ